MQMVEAPILIGESNSLTYANAFNVNSKEKHGNATAIPLEMTIRRVPSYIRRYIGDALIYNAAFQRPKLHSHGNVHIDCSV